LNLFFPPQTLLFQGGQVDCVHPRRPFADRHHVRCIASDGGHDERAGAIDLNRTTGVTIVSDFDRKPFEAAMADIYAKARHDPSAAAAIERVRKVN
jgi:hypothetical protein